MKKSKKIVIKLGSSLLTNKKGGVNKSVLKNVVKDIVWLLNSKKEVIVVSSGAISLGKGKLNLNNDLTLNESQAVAARGQIELMTAWQNEFKKHKKQVAQILLSPSDIKNKKSSNNAMAIALFDDFLFFISEGDRSICATCFLCFLNSFCHAVINSI